MLLNERLSEEMVTRIDKKMHTEVWCGNHKRREHLEELSVGEKIT
jgi:hypothetical protein